VDHGPVFTVRHGNTDTIVRAKNEVNIRTVMTAINLATWTCMATAHFYRAMHFSAIACRLSIYPSVCDVGDL